MPRRGEFGTVGQGERRKLSAQNCDLDVHTYRFVELEAFYREVLVVNLMHPKSPLPRGLNLINVLIKSNLPSGKKV